MFNQPKTFVELKPGEYVVSVRPSKIILWTLTLLGAATLLLAVFGCAPSKAQSYLRIDAGGAYLAPTSLTTPFGNSKLNAKTGEAISIAYGYQFNTFLKAEIEGGYLRADFKSLDNIGTVSGNTSSFIGFGNGILNIPISSDFSVYTGGGIGFANTHAEFSNIASIPVALTQDKTSFAAQGIAGIDYAISTSLSIGARYKYLWIANQQDFTVLGVTVHQDNAAAHLFSATLTYRF